MRVETHTNINFDVSDYSRSLLVQGRITGEMETPQDMIARVVNRLASVEENLGHAPQDTVNFLTDLIRSLEAKKCIFSTPILTNAGRYEDRPLSACTIPPVDLREDLQMIRALLDTFHRHGMGTGFNLSDVDDPVAVLHYLNDIAVAGAQSGKEDRPVGNIGVLSVHHPRIIEFIKAKNSVNTGKQWNFNVSVDISDEFMLAVKDNTEYKLFDGNYLRANDVLMEMCNGAWTTGDPGILFLDRMKRDNPTPGLGEYTGTAPCSEVGLAPGESCQFGYINLAAFYHHRELDLAGLQETTALMVRALDDALELSISKYAHPKNSEVMRAKRKIGVGICGLADLLAKMGLSYSSAEARSLMLDIITFINFSSKVASHELAKIRGPFPAMSDMIGNKYNQTPSFLAQRYGGLNTQWVRSEDWLELGQLIQSTGALRHASTTALPPTGRSGLIIDASTGVEPSFFMVSPNGNIYPPLMEKLQELGLDQDSIIEEVLASGSIQHVADIPDSLKLIFQTALEILPEDHLLMVSQLQRGIDESISKTVNLSSNCTPDDIAKIYCMAYQLGLKGITIYRANSRTNQPKKLER